MTLQRNDLSRDSVCVNGLWLEDIIKGFHIISSTGREVLTKEVVTNQYRRDGSVTDHTRFPERIINVKYILDGTDSADFRNNCTDLYRLLNVEDVDIQFNDEFGKFYTGSISVEQPEERYGIVYAGSFNIVCPDPFKYSTSVMEANPTYTGSSAQFLINYNGTYPARPVLQASFAGALESGIYSEDGDCGYVAFMDEEENIIQIGNPDALDLDVSRTAPTLQNNYLSSLSEFSVTGTLTPGQNIADPYWSRGTGQTLPYTKPTGTASLQYTVPSGAQNFDIALMQRMAVSATTEVGTFYCYCYDAEDNIICGYKIDKSSSGTTGKVYYYINGSTAKKNVNIDLSYYNTNFGYCNRTQAYKTVSTKYYYNKKKKKWQTSKIKGAKTKIVKTQVANGYNYTQSNLNSSISKSGGTVTFNIGNCASETFTYGDVALTAITKVKIGFTGDINTNALRLFKMVRNPGDSFLDQDNVFTAGQTVQADCNDASIYIMEGETEEGHFAPEYGALGNDWESFILQPGINTIQATWSPWVDTDYKPTLKIIWNEVFI